MSAENRARERLLPKLPLSNTTSLRVIASNRERTCTYKYLKTNFVEQEFFRCKTCFKGENSGCCKPCTMTCHYNHDTSSIGLVGAFCDCGMTGCRISCNGSNKCTYDEYGQTPRRQKWYQCITCWGEDSVFGCCQECANDCHPNHDLIPCDPSPMICNCGHNRHRPTVCTLYTTKNNYQKQPFYYCFNCFSSPNDGCCYQCMKVCHDGHRVRFKGSMRSYCDCSSPACSIKCKITEPNQH